MRKYLSIYSRLLKLNFAYLTVYRANFMNALISSTGYGILSFLLIILLTSHSKTIYGWKREEIILLMGLYNIIIGGIFHMIFSRNFERFASIIHFGRLDSILLKPVDSQFFLSCYVVAYTQIVRIIMGLIVVIYIIKTSSMIITLGSILGFCFLALFGILILYSIWFIILTSLIWFSRLSNLVELMYHFNDLIRFPPEIYKPLGGFFIFIVPYTLILITPTKLLLRRFSFGEMTLLFLTSFCLLLISRKFWKFALRYYTSASS